jgi:hypothetical protein
MDRRDVLRWVEGFRAAAARDREDLRANPPDPAEMWARSQRLAATFPSSPFDEPTNLAFHLTWARLRKAAATR